eukprot:1297465-Karenia_brevis.AAC.1
MAWNVQSEAYASPKVSDPFNSDEMQLEGLQEARDDESRSLEAGLAPIHLFYLDLLTAVSRGKLGKQGGKDDVVPWR